MWLWIKVGLTWSGVLRGEIVLCGVGWDLWGGWGGWGGGPAEAGTTCGFGLFGGELEVGLAEFFQSVFDGGDSLFVCGEVAQVMGIIAGEAGLDGAVFGKAELDKGDEVLCAWQFCGEVQAFDFL